MEIKIRYKKLIAGFAINNFLVSDFKFFDNAVAVLYGISAIPRNLLVDPQGKIVATDLRGEKLEETLAQLLGNM